VEDDIAERAEELKRRISDRRDHCLEQRQPRLEDACQLWLPAPAASGAAPQAPQAPAGPASVAAPPARPGNGGSAAADLPPGVEEDSLASLIVDLFDIGCLLFGEYVQASGALFSYYIDLRQIISDPNLFHRVLHTYAGKLEGLMFERIAGIPYGSLPTATGLSLQLHKPLIYPRKEVKAHGARRLIEGDFNEGDTVVVVDDILITGGSVLEGIAKLEGSGLVVTDVVVFIDHGGEADDSARRRLEKGGYRCHAVLDIARITRVLHRAGRLSDAETALLGHGGSKGVLASS
jgi:uridine monophosphate synthetase